MYQKIIENGYISGVSTGTTSGNITEEEYNRIVEVIHAKPVPTDGFDYRLKEDLTWEMVDIEHDI